MGERLDRIPVFGSHVLPRSAGIYVIGNMKNGKVYVGSARDLNARWRTHSWALRKGVHRNSHLQNAWNTHGSRAFSFFVMQLCHPDELQVREQAMMDLSKCTDRMIGYNMAPMARSSKGTKASIQTRLLQSMQRKGRKVVITPEWREKLAAANRGKKLSEDHRRQISRGLAWKMKLSPDQVREIRRRHASGESTRCLYKSFKCGHSIIGKVLQRIGNYDFE